MKKIMAVAFTLLLTLQCGCSRMDTMDSTRIVTACFARNLENALSYTFCVAQPASGKDSESGDLQNKSKLFSFEASNFEDALNKFEQSIGQYDLSHMEAFFVDTGYLENHFFTDSDHIRKKLRISPLIKMIAADVKPEDISDAVGKCYDNSFKNLTDSLFSKERKNLICTMSELFLASENRFFTASLPFVSVNNDSGVAVNDSAVVINRTSGCAYLTGSDYNVYSSCIKKYGKTADGMKLAVKRQSIDVEFYRNDKNALKLIGVAEKYNSSGFDILNVMYFSKKCFMTYGAYLDYISRLGVENIKYV